MKNLKKTLALSLAALSILSVSYAIPTQALTFRRPPIITPVQPVASISVSINKTYADPENIPEKIYYEAVPSNGYKYVGYLYARDITENPNGTFNVKYSGTLNLNTLPIM